MRNLHRSHRIWLFLLLSLPFVASAFASDWSQYRGAEGKGISAEKDLDRSWPEKGPAETWRRPIGDAFSGMSVVGDRLFTTEIRDGEQQVVALDAASGKTLWSTGFGTDYQDGNGFGHGPRMTPTVDGDRVYAVSADSILVALRVENGELIWKSDFKEDFGAEAPRFGFGSSPFVLRDLLVIETGGPEGKSIVALDKMTGEVRWSVLDDAASYATPILVTLGGREQLIFNRRSGLVALAADTGESLWRHDSAPDTIVMPIFVEPDAFFISSAAMGDGGHLIRVVHGEGGFQTEVVWSNSRFRNHFNNAVLVDGYFYGFDNATFRCVDAKSGENRWAHRGYGKGSLVAADGLLFVLSDKGLLALVEATPEAFRELGKVQAMEGRSWTSPTLASGRLFVRDHDEMVAFEVRGGSTEAAQSAAGPAGTTESASGMKMPKTAEEVLALHVEARGGFQAWKAIRSLEWKGTYSAFSRESPFLQLHQRDAETDRFRLDFENLGGEAIWSRDGEGFWVVFPLLGIMEPSRLTEPPGSLYVPQFERRAEIEPGLLNWKERGYEVSVVGMSRVGDRETFALEVQLAEGREETWHFDPGTWLEVAVDSMIYDFSQGTEPMKQCFFFGDFREIDGVRLPYEMSIEFGARLEEIQVESAIVNNPIDPARFEFPAAEADDATVTEDGEP